MRNRIAWIYLCLVLMVVPLLAGIGVSFAPVDPIDFAVGTEVGVHPLGVGQVDSDQNVDLVVVANDDEQVYFLSGQGDGTFAEGVVIGAASFATTVAIADLTSPFETGGDVDGIADVVVADDIGELQIFIGRGDGTFDPPDQQFDTLDTVEIAAVAAADFNQDGRDDLAVLEGFDGVYFLCNNEGFFEPCPTAVIFLDLFSFELVDLAVGDFDGGGLDVAVIDREVGELYVISGNDDGTFEEVDAAIAVAGPGSQAPEGLQPRALRVGRVNGDELDDIVILSEDLEENTSHISIFAGTSGPLQDSFAIYPVGEVAQALVLRDIDNDGDLDALVSGVDDLGQEPTAALLAGDGAGGFGSPISAGLDAVAGASALEVADLDADGRLDLVAVVNEGTQIRPVLNGEATSSCAGDCNGDGAVRIGELIIGVNIALDRAEVDSCAAMDTNRDGAIRIGELIAAVNSALDGCG